MTFELNRKLVDGLAPSPTLGATGPPPSPAQQHAKSPHSDRTHRNGGPFNATHRRLIYSTKRVVNQCTVSSSKKDGNGILSFIFLQYFLWLGRNSYYHFRGNHRPRNVCSLNMAFYILRNMHIFLNNHVKLKSAVIMLKIQLYHNRNKLHF